MIYKGLPSRGIKQLFRNKEAARMSCGKGLSLIYQASTKHTITCILAKRYLKRAVDRNLLRRILKAQTYVFIKHMTTGVDVVWLLKTKITPLPFNKFDLTQQSLNCLRRLILT